MDLEAICGVLKATQSTEDAARKGAEQKLDEAAKKDPSRLTAALVDVLKAAGTVPAVTNALRQEAAVLLRQLMVGTKSRESVWERLEEAAQKAVMAQLLASLEGDSDATVRRSAGKAVSGIAEMVSEDFDDVRQEWPELLPALARLVTPGRDPATRSAALQVLRDLVEEIGDPFADGMMSQGDQAIAMLASALSDESPEVRSSGAQLVLGLIAAIPKDKDRPLTQVMPAVVLALQGFANMAQEEPLNEVLEALAMVVETKATFFKDCCFQELWTMIMQVASSGAEVFHMQSIRHSAMEAAMTLACALVEDFSRADGQLLLEGLVTLNVAWMMEVEEDVAQWTTSADEKDEDECDDEVVELGEENMDRLAEDFSEEVFMPLLFKVLRATTQAPGAGWKHIRSSVMAIAQVVEYLDDDTWVDQCVEMVAKAVGHEHPRVRYSAFAAIAQLCYDQAPHVQDKHGEQLLPLMIGGLKDDNIRVATIAATSFAALSDDLDDYSALEPYMAELLQLLFDRLQRGETRWMQEQCLAGITMCASTAEEEFEPYYVTVMPTLKHLLASLTNEDQRTLRGKVFDCVSMVGEAVGKEIFLQDAHEVMRTMAPLMQAGFAADDMMRESVVEAAVRIAETIEKDFQPYVPALLPGIFQALSHRPTEVDDDDDDDDDDEADMTFRLVQDKTLGLKTSLIEEMLEALELLNTLIEALEEDFCEFMPQTCQNILPLLDFQVSEAVRKEVFKLWEVLAKCARSAVNSGRINQSVLQELVTRFLQTTVGSMSQVGTDDLDVGILGELQAKAIGIAGVIQRAGDGVLTAEALRDVSTVVARLLGGIVCTPDEVALPDSRRSRGAPAVEEDDEDDENDTDATATRQSLRYCLVDVAGAMMRVNQAAFLEVAAANFMQYVQMLLSPDHGEADRALAFYIADDVVDCLGERSVPYWDFVMNKALQHMTDKSAVVRQYAIRTMGSGARLPVFAPMAPTVAVRLYQALQRQGERHRRRRAVKVDAKQTALAMDASIRALGLICEHHEATLGNDAGMAWAMWLSGLPLKYDKEEGLKAHRQLLDLVVRQHPWVTSQEQLPKVLNVFAEVYHSRYSSKELDSDIATTIARVGEAPLKGLSSSLPEKQQNKLEQILRAGSKVGASKAGA